MARRRSNNKVGSVAFSQGVGGGGEPLLEGLSVAMLVGWVGGGEIGVGSILQGVGGCLCVRVWDDESVHLVVKRLFQINHWGSTILSNMLVMRMRTVRGLV